MNINTNSWHFKVWKHFTGLPRYRWDEANFCEYTRTIFIKAPACCLMILLLGSIIVAAQLALAIPAIIIGWVPNHRFFFESDPVPFKRYNGLQLPRKAPNLPWELYPWHILLPVALVAVQWVIIHFNGWYLPSIIEGGVLAGIAVLVVAYFYENGETETIRLLKAKAESKHRMICPLITFTEEPTSTNPEE